MAAGLVAYAFWVYLRVELPVPAGPWLAGVRAGALVLVLLLLFNPSLPRSDGGAGAPRWVLLDGSMSMQAGAEGGTSAWSEARARAEGLAEQGWRIMRFGGGGLVRDSALTVPPEGLESRLAPALSAAAEAGAREVRVLSDARLEDMVAVRSALRTLPLEVIFETFEDAVSNAGVVSLQVPDVVSAEDAPTAVVELFGQGVGDSLTVEVREDGRPVASATVATPSPGRTTTARVELPAPEGDGRIRYTASVSTEAGDDFPEDDRAVAYANVGFQSGGLLLLSVRPDWEPRFLLPVLEEVTGLEASGYLRAGPNRFVPLGRAVGRRETVDSTLVRRATEEAVFLVLHGFTGEADAWIRDRVAGSGRALLFPADAAAAELSGVPASEPRDGEWYVSPDVPASPVAGALTGASLEGLPPLTDVLVPVDALVNPPLHLQLRGAGAPESAVALLQRPEGRRAVVLASGFWRWAMREQGRDAYRRLWSGVAGWLLAERGIASARPRPVRWVFPRDEPVRWSIPGDTSSVRIVLRKDRGAVVDTVVTGREVSVGRLPPGSYDYTVSGPGGDTLTQGRLDVASTTREMIPRSEKPVAEQADGERESEVASGRPLRTSPWPYLLVILLLCGEWVVRRRSGLR